MKTPFYFDVDIEWGHLRVGPLILTWFNSDTSWDSWGSIDIIWNFNYSFLFGFHEWRHRPFVTSKRIDPEISQALRGSKEL